MTTSVQSLAPTATVELKLKENESSLRALAQLVARIYLIYSKIAQNDRKEIVELETEYRIFTRESADLTRSRGNYTLGTTFLSFTTFAISMAFANKTDKKFIQMVSDKVPDLFRLIDARKEANIRSKDALSQLEMTKIQDKNSKQQTEGNVKDQFAQILQAEIQRLRNAATSN